MRLYPTPRQEKIIDQTIGNSRFIYNRMLEERIAVYGKLKDDKPALYSYKYKTEKEYKQEFDFLKLGSSRALQQARGNLDVAYRNFFSSLKKGKKAGFPQFKKKSKSKWSYREPQVGTAIRIEGSTIVLLKLGAVKFRGLDPKFSGRICSVTVSKDRDNKYYASILVEKGTVDKKFRTGNGIVGVDLGLKTFAVDSVGNFYNGVRKQVAKIESKIKHLQRHFNRKKNPSTRKEKLRVKIAKEYKYKTNIQNHFFWHLANQLCRDNQTIVVENLAVRNLMRNRKLSHAIQTTGWGRCIDILKHKSVEYFTDVVEAPRFFPSTKTCSSCGKINEIKLSDRVYSCDCGNVIDRDLNAAINLKKYKSAEHVDNTCGESVRPVELIFNLAGGFLRSENSFCG